MSFPVGSRVVLQDQAEGWFPLAPREGLTGTVIRAIPRHPHSAPFYVVRLDTTLSIQEPDQDTPSGLRLVAYEHVVVAPRWLGSDLGSHPAVSVYLLSVPPDRQLPAIAEDCEGLPLRTWASCSVLKPSTGLS